MPSPTTAGCPCGVEPVDPVHGGGLIGAECARRVLKNLRWWLQRRYPGDHEDFVQDVYLRLLGDKGLHTFVPPPCGGPGPFRGWLYGVVRYYALYTIQQRDQRNHIQLAKTEVLPEPVSGAQAFARICICEIVEAASSTVEKRWTAKGPEWAERFKVFIRFVWGEDADYGRARARLCISYTLARRVHHDLKEEICFHVRARVRDTLRLEPELEPETIEQMIDQEIRSLFEEAFPDDCVWDLFFPHPKREPETDEPRSKP